MDLSLTAEVAAPPAAVFAEVRDLGGYPAWLDLVEGAVPGPPSGPAGADRDDSLPAWSVTLGARLGPIRRTKQLRMVRVAEEAPTLVRFERAETDGRPHASWILTVVIEPSVAGPGPRAHLTMRLEYGGRFWLPFLEQVVREEARRAGPRLAARLGAGA